MNKRTTGIVIALTAGALFATTSMAEHHGHHASHSKAAVKCMMDDSNRGSSSNILSGANSSSDRHSILSGNHSSKNKSYVMAKSAQICKEMGGHVVAMSSKHTVHTTKAHNM